MSELVNKDNYLIEGPLEGKEWIVAKLTADTADIDIRGYNIFRVLFGGQLVGYVFINITKTQWKFLILIFTEFRREPHAFNCMKSIKDMFVKDALPNSLLITRGLYYQLESARACGFVRVDDPNNYNNYYYVYGPKSQIDSFKKNLITDYNESKYKVFTELKKLSCRIKNF